MSAIQADIEARLAETEPNVEVLLAEISGSTVRLFIDHPDGVTIDMCERVSHRLGDLRRDYGLEVSSPGARRPLTKPEHYRRFIGRRARVRTRAPVAGGRGSPGRRSFTGELVGASDGEVTVAAPEGVVAIPYADIQRSNLVGD
jgi:ribosome maturation factor RimP